MKRNNLYLYLIALCFIWAGMLLGISFLEAPVKFTAPSLTLSVGLDVGRHVFQAFNKVEIVFATLLLLLMIKLKLPFKINILLSVVLLLLTLQCFWLLPALDERAIAIISGQMPTTPSPHIWYILFEVVKLGSLISAGVLCFLKATVNHPILIRSN